MDAGDIAAVVAAGVAVIAAIVAVFQTSAATDQAASARDSAAAAETQAVEAGRQAEAAEDAVRVAKSQLAALEREAADRQHAIIREAADEIFSSCMRIRAPARDLIDYLDSGGQVGSDTWSGIVEPYVTEVLSLATATGKITPHAHLSSFRAELKSLLDSLQVAATVIAGLGESAKNAEDFSIKIVAEDGRRALDAMFEQAVNMYIESIKWSGQVGVLNALRAIVEKKTQ